MNWRIVSVGKPKLDYARAGIAEYVARLRHVTTLEMLTVPASDPAREGDALLRLSEGHQRIVLDESGRQLDSRAFSARIEAWEQNRVKSIALLIGGANGHAARVREAADWVWSLSSLTLQHELALVVLLEQFYRAYSIKAGTPYHRDGSCRSDR